MKKFLPDIIFYLVFPLLIWNAFRTDLGDYYAMLLTTLPGFLYTIYVFIREKEISKSGIFILIALLASRSLDLMSNSATQILWNAVYMNFVYVVFWLITIIIKKPMGIYFFIDYAYLQGVPRENSRLLYFGDVFFKHMKYFTLFLAAKDLLTGFIRIYLINKYGIEGFNEITVILKTVSYTLGGLTGLYVYMLVKKVVKYNEETKILDSDSNA